MDQNLLRESIRIMTQEIQTAPGCSLHSFWLYGSVVLNDFRPGWSDIDFIAFTNDPIGPEQANQLLLLRQTLSERYTDNPYFRCFEGVIVNRKEYQSGQYDRLVYWGTSGQRITNRCCIDPFSMLELSKYSVLICGEEDRDLFKMPKKEELVAAVRRHYEGIRRCAVRTDDSLYSCGWLLDIARCIYTLRTGDVIGKTQAGEWALSEHLFFNEEPLKRTLAIRRDPLLFRDDPETKVWLKTLGPTVQQYADVLERELSHYIIYHNIFEFREPFGFSLRLYR